MPDSLLMVSIVIVIVFMFQHLGSAVWMLKENTKDTVQLLI